MRPWLELARAWTFAWVFVRQNAGRLARALLRWCMLFGGVVVFVVLGSELYFRNRTALDGWVFDWLLSIRSPWMTELMSAATDLGGSRMLAALVVIGGLFFGILHHARSALFLGAVGIGAALLNGGLKALFSRDRPDALLQVVPAEGYAFPSGHSMGSAAVYAAIALIAATRFPRYRAPVIAICALVVLSVGFSRAYLFVHYPSDVLAGWGLGLTWALWLKPSLLGPGFRPATVPDDELIEDGVDPTLTRQG
jgi:undecaprenyl-diphosphatase